MNDSIRATITVSYEHQVHFTHGAFRVDNPLLADVLASKPSNRIPRVLVVVDQNLAAAQPALAPAIRDYFADRNGQFELVPDLLRVSGGETAKNSEAAVKRIYGAIEEHGLCRHCYILGIGGGALLDVVGFAAATAHRGVRHVRLPTTVLAQDDAGVGVKNGINAFGKKNFIGTFAPPFAVINDFDLLTSLPEREKRAGYIEAIKVALIRDARFFAWIEQNQAALRAFQPAAVETLIRRCAEAHVRHIATGGDPFEQGSARPLDFGHWAAHKLEQLSEFRIHHGEAVAIGIALDVTYSVLAGFLDATTGERILQLIEALGFELWSAQLAHQSSTGKRSVLHGLEEFREHLGGALTITLLKRIGEGFEVHEMEEARVLEAIEILSRRKR
jgi:3-dehydroquinate synthase